jgi:N-acetyl-1-D-myo-inositol-2-amino-2-deoxy-alpha-D-glucopyranoside deacetylase
MADGERVLFVHAHPDDETIDTGGTIAALVAGGAHVTVLTCTRGERGEVIPDDLKRALESRATMAELRESELTIAMSALGVTDHRYLGMSGARWQGHGDRSYVDSGMRWGTRGAEAIDDADPSTLTSADFADVTSDIASVIIASDPGAVISYDENGGYGHPDHLRVHDAARRAADLYGVPFFAVRPERQDATGSALASEPGVSKPSVSVDISAVLDRKRAALAAYRSQLTLDGDTIELSGGQRFPVGVEERYDLLDPESGDDIPFSQARPGVRFAVYVLVGIVGAVFGALLTVYNQATAVIAGQNIWVGVIASVVITAALFVGLRLAFETRVVAGFAAVAMIVVVGVLSLLGAGGSVVIPWNGPGITWQVAPTIVAFVVLIWPQKREPRAG